MIKGKVSCLLLHSDAENVESNENIFGFFFNFNIINIIADKTNLRIQSSIDRLPTSNLRISHESNKYTCVKVANTIELKPLFG